MKKLLQLYQTHLYNFFHFLLHFLRLCTIKLPTSSALISDKGVKSGEKRVPKAPLDQPFLKVEKIEKIEKVEKVEERLKNYASGACVIYLFQF